MSEKIPNAELCSSCPNRTSISRMLGRLSSKIIVGTDCEGVVTVTNENEILEVRQKGEPEPVSPLGGWNVVTESLIDGMRTYSAIERKILELCGKEAIRLAEKSEDSNDKPNS
jgi:hypothetical protein